jgi:hypothetical protein
MSAPLQQRLAELLEFWECNRALKTDGLDVIERRCVDEFQSVRGSCGSMSLGVATTCLQMIMNSTLSPSTKQTLAAAVNETSSVSEKSCATLATRDIAKVALQKHSFVHEYLTARDWSHLHNDKLDTASKLRVLSNRCIKMGLLYPNENTYVFLTAIVVASDRPKETCWVVPAAESLHILCSIKGVFKALRKPGASLAGPDIYPPSPDAFKISHKALPVAEFR